MESPLTYLEQENRHLVDENERLKLELQELKSFDLLSSRLFSSLVTRLQVNTASIKAAVSSLLDWNIFWDVSAQKEFLEAISQSVDNISALMTHIALLNLVQINNLEVTRKPYESHELMMAVQDRVYQMCGCHFSYQDNAAKGSLVMVDYKYFVHALSTLFYVTGVRNEQNVSMDALPNMVEITVRGVAQPIIKVIDDILRKEWSSSSIQNSLPPEKVYLLLLIVSLFEQQGVLVKLCDDQTNTLQISIPT